MPDPCQPNPCGVNSVCRTNAAGQPVCSCQPGYFGIPCRPECTINSDCPTSRGCLNAKCVDPCPGACGVNAVCSVVAHNPVCRCPDGLTGDPFSICFEKGKIEVLNASGLILDTDVNEWHDIVCNS